MPRLIELDTARLHLRQWREDDLRPFADLNADPEVMAHFPAPLEYPASNALALRCQALIAERGWGFWAAELKESGQFIGFVGLHTPIAELLFAPCVEVGWRLARAYWGRGLATEAACAALRVGFETLELQEIVSFTTLGNLRSRAVMERIGMHRTDEDFDHPAVPPGSPLRAHCLYRLNRDGWRKPRG